MTDDKERVYNCWSEDFPNASAEEIEASRPASAAKVWFESRWWSLGRPDEVRVFVRRMSDQHLFAFDVHVEGVELDMTAMDVELDADGKPVDLAPIDPGEKPASPSVPFNFDEEPAR